MVIEQMYGVRAFKTEQPKKRKAGKIGITLFLKLKKSDFMPVIFLETRERKVLYI
jgi:hypothetical protein